MKLSEYKKLKQLLDNEEFSKPYQFNFKGTRETDDYGFGDKHNYRISLFPTNECIHCIMDLMKEIQNVPGNFNAYIKFWGAGCVKLF